jgi:hypothetical protein
MEPFVITVTVDEAAFAARLSVIDGMATSEGCIVIPDAEGGLADSSCDLGDLTPGTYSVTGNGAAGEVGCFMRWFSSASREATSLRTVVCEVR